MSFETYVLISINDKLRYIGSDENADERLRRHNKGNYQFTKGHKPWKLVHRESFENRADAMKREKFLKSGQGRKWLDIQGIK
jgi:predicted GIY-YIG superfamily endonuclease